MVCAIWLASYAVQEGRATAQDVSAQTDVATMVSADITGVTELEAEAPASPAPNCPIGDMDKDGLCDTLERATGTRALRADSDADGVPDGIEDINRDGVHDPGESDPRTPGLFPGTYPHIPEPMLFDLVRGLGARRDEVEVNTLAVFEWRGRGASPLAWAPEVEWAFLDGAAIELELPMHGRELEALKSALQLTLPSPRESTVTHGVQIIGEYFFEPRLRKESAPHLSPASRRDVDLTALYLVARRAGKWSLLAMGGARTLVPVDARGQVELLLNPSLFHDVSEALTLGLESNLAVDLLGRIAAAVIPQLHWQVSKTVRIQLGAGLRVIRGHDVEPLVAARVILE